MSNHKRPDEVRPHPPASRSAGPLSPDSNQQMLHDLRVHQIELEAQNEELRRTQHQLELARERYFDLYELAPVGYLTLSQAGIVQDANLTFADLLKVPRSELVAQPLTRFILPEDQDIYYGHRKRLFETRVRQVSELRMLSRGAKPRWVRLEETLSKDASGAPVGRAVVSDISVRKDAEEAIVASEVRHRILFEKSRDALMTLAPPHWRFTSGNSTAIMLFGAKDEQDFVSHPLTEYSPAQQPDGSSSVERGPEMIERAMRDGSLYGEWIFKRLSGEEFAATVLLTRIEIHGQPLLQATVRDETETKKFHAVLSQRDRLASMGLLAASVAHEINNPLASVLYNIETLAEDLPRLSNAVARCVRALVAQHGPEAVATFAGDEAEMLETSVLNDFIDRAREALGGTQRIRTIARAIGTFARVETTEGRRVDLNYAIKCAAALAQNEIRFRAKLVLDYGQLPPIWASEGKLSQVFLNLLLNAAHAIGDGDPKKDEIRIRTWVDAENVFAEVQDTGAGIARQNLGRIFEPFFTTKPVGVGSGLGLSICRNIIAEFGGDLRVESELGAGARFVVRLPVRQRASELPRARVAAAPTPARARGRILVVDDEPAIRSIVARVLEREHEIVTAASGDAAREILDNDPHFDVIICDLMMPGMTGMDLHEWLVTHRPALAQRTVFISGGAFTERASEYVARVGNTRLDKPFDPATLTRVVSEMLSFQRP